MHSENLLYDALGGGLNVFVSSALHLSLGHRDFRVLTKNHNNRVFSDFLPVLPHPRPSKELCMQNFKSICYLNYHHIGPSDGSFLCIDYLNM